MIDEMGITDGLKNKKDLRHRKSFFSVFGMVGSTRFELVTPAV